MKIKSVELVANPKTPHFVGDGFRVHNFIPSGYRIDMQRMSPFIMMDYNSTYNFPPRKTHSKKKHFSTSKYPIATDGSSLGYLEVVLFCEDL